MEIVRALSAWLARLVHVNLLGEKRNTLNFKGLFASLWITNMSYWDLNKDVFCFIVALNTLLLCHFAANGEPHISLDI